MLGHARARYDGGQRFAALSTCNQRRCGFYMLLSKVHFPKNNVSFMPQNTCPERIIFSKMEPCEMTHPSGHYFKPRFLFSLMSMCDANKQRTLGGRHSVALSQFATQNFVTSRTLFLRQSLSDGMRSLKEEP